MSVGFEAMFEFLRISAKTAKRCETCEATYSAFPYLYPITVGSQPARSLGFSHICPNPQHQVLQIKMWFYSGERSSKHSNVRTHVIFLSTAPNFKWHKLLLLSVFQIKTGFSEIKMISPFLTSEILQTNYSNCHVCKTPCIWLCPLTYQLTLRSIQWADTGHKCLKLGKQECCWQRGWKIQLFKLDSHQGSQNSDLCTEVLHYRRIMVQLI